MARNWLCAAVSALLFAAGPSAAQRADPVPEIAGPVVGPVASEHRVAIGGSELRYKALFQEFELQSGEGRPLATISATAYLRSDVERSSQRPVFFFFNGGPGASSSPLHFSAFGPRLRPRDGKPTDPFVDNPDSPLDVADLVFIDPVGTGFSRVLPGGDGKPFWAPRGDADAVLSLIHRWLKAQGRAGSPVFIGGESYGSYRLATMMRDAGELDLRGLLMISPSTSTAYMAGAAADHLDRIFALPVMAIAAWHHDAIERAGRTAEQHHSDALAFAESDYLVALHKGAELPAGERRRIAQKMAGLIGLPAELIERERLLVSNDLFVESLLAKRNLLVGRLDTRVTAPKAPPRRQDRPAAANDPSLGLGRSNVILSEAISRYMREELKVPIERDYVSLTLDVNFNWNWFEPVEDRRLYHNPLGHVAALMGSRPRLGLMVAGGLYDLVTPTAAARHAIRHSGMDLDRVTFLTLPSGHSPFEEPANRARFAGALREFIRSGIAGPTN